MKIFAEGNDGKKSKPFIKTVDIQILISEPVSTMSNIGDWIGKNLMALLSTLIISLVVFLYNRRKKNTGDVK